MIKRNRLFQLRLLEVSAGDPLGPLSFGEGSHHGRNIGEQRAYVIVQAGLKLSLFQSE